MFKNREFRLRVVNTNKTPTETIMIRPRVTPEQISKIAKEQTRTVAIVIGAGYVLKKVVDTASEMTLLQAAAKLR